ncbi:MAG: IspD/TarI family cytidylyltransferase [Mycoplasmoidaceae bacterium]
MNIAIILAAGKSLRIKNVIPKQLINFKDKPVIIHTIDKFINHEIIDKIIVVTSDCLKNDFTRLIKNYYKEEGKITLINGGMTRSHSLYLAYQYICEYQDISDNDIILTHDGVRIFVSKQLISKSINCCNHKHTVIPVIDTTDSIIEVSNNNHKMIDRNNFKMIQTPQVVTFKNLKSIFYNIDKNLLLNNDYELTWFSNKFDIKILTINGEKSNFKITTEEDLLYAKWLIEKND